MELTLFVSSKLMVERMYSLLEYIGLALGLICTLKKLTHNIQQNIILAPLQATLTAMSDKNNILTKQKLLKWGWKMKYFKSPTYFTFYNPNGFEIKNQHKYQISIIYISQKWTNLAKEGSLTWPKAVFRGLLAKVWHFCTWYSKFLIGTHLV